MAFSFEYDPVTKKFGMSVGTPPEDFTDIGATRDPFGDFKGLSPAVGIPGGSGTSGGKKGGEGNLISQFLDLIGIHDSVVKPPAEGAKTGTKPSGKSPAAQSKTADNGSAQSMSAKSGDKFSAAEGVAKLLADFDSVLGTKPKPLPLQLTPGMMIPIDPDMGFRR